MTPEEGTMSFTFSGGCACGQVRYTCSERPLVQLICHCRDCQRASGSAFAAVVIVPTDRLSFNEGELGEHPVIAESGRTMRRRFCASCGTPISIFRPETPQVEFLTAGSLDDPAVFQPTCEVWMSRADPWHPRHPDTEKFAEGPAAEAVRAPIQAYFAGRK